MKVLRFDLIDYISFIVTAGFVTLICLDAYMAGGAYIDGLIYSAIMGA